MKRPFFLRLPFRLLPIIAVLTLLTFRSAVRRNSISDQLLFSNTTLLRLSSTDLADSVVKRDVDDLIEGKFPTYSRDSSILRRHRIDGIRSMNRRLGLGIQIRFPSFHNNKLFPELRKSLHQWWKNRRFQPEIMSELVDLVKLPLDRHRGKENSAGRFGSCAVVGNSGILLKNDYGDLIDSHELVIRLNNARIHGFQRNVGVKTDLSFVNSNILHLCGRRPSCFCHPYGDTVPMIMYICQAAHFLDYTICNSSYKAPLLITDIRFDMLCSRIAKYYSMRRFAEVEGKRLEDWGKFHDEKLFHYSSGMQAVLLAVGICDRVGVFGFGKSADAKHHYHTNQKVELDLHDYAAEYDFYRDLIDRPEVIPFLKDSGIRVPPLVLYH